MGNTETAHALCGAGRTGLVDTDPCEGAPDAVLLLDQRRMPTAEDKELRSLRACVRHGAQLYALMQAARVYPNGPDHAGKAIEVYKRAQVYAQERADANVVAAVSYWHRTGNDEYLRRWSA